MCRPCVGCVRFAGHDFASAVVVVMFCFSVCLVDGLCVTYMYVCSSPQTGIGQVRRVHWW